MNAYTIGDVVGLGIPLGGMKPGWYVLLELSGTRVRLATVGEDPSGDLCARCDRLHVTNVDSLCAFKPIGLRLSNAVEIPALSQSNP